MKILTGRYDNVIIDRLLINVETRRKELQDGLVFNTPADIKDIGIIIGMIRMLGELPGMISKTIREQDEEV
jgi:hypothetical protein